MTSLSYAGGVTQITRTSRRGARTSDHCYGDHWHGDGDCVWRTCAVTVTEQGELSLRVRVAVSALCSPRLPPGQAALVQKACALRRTPPNSAGHSHGHHCTSTQPFGHPGHHYVMCVERVSWAIIMMEDPGWGETSHSNLSLSSHTITSSSLSWAWVTPATRDWKLGFFFQ